MVTDDERRRVAAELRGLDRLEYSMLDVVDATGERYLPNFPSRLADLIEPPAKLYDSPDSSNIEADMGREPVVDREALLELADHMETYGLGECMAVSMQVALDEYARRIREACGAVA